MDWFTAIAVYFLIWWVTIFMVLPIGVVRPDEQSTGHDGGAPAIPNLKKKFVWNTGLALVVWLAGYGLIQIFDFNMMETFR